MAVQTLKDLLDAGVEGRTVLVRSDLNVPLDGATITDPGRIVASAPTIEALAEAGAKVIVMAHLGRPKGEPDPKFSLAPVAAKLGEVLGRNVQLAGDVVGQDALARSEGLTDGDVLLLENIRFDPRETSKDEPSASGARPAISSSSSATTARSSPTVSVSCTASRRRSTTWRSCSRTTPVTSSRAEVEVLAEAHAGHRASVRGRARRLEGLRQARRDRGARAEGRHPGHRWRNVLHIPCGTGHFGGQFAVLEESMIEHLQGPARPVRRRHPHPAGRRDRRLASRPTPKSKTVPVTEIPDGWMGLDIGPESVQRFASMLSAAKTVFWNGPMGVFEFPKFAAGTKGVAEAIVDATGKGAFSVVGGGDSAAAVRQLGLPDDGLLAHLHRRRRLPRIPRGQGTARHLGSGGLSAMARTAADRGQLEDESEPPRGHRAGAEDRVHVARRSTSRRSTSRSSRRSPTSVRCRR